MDIVIIEDEPLTAEDLADTILEVDDSAQILVTLESVHEAVEYLRNNDTPDLIFSDIHLSDGLCFEIFQKLDVPAPVIFCTAYDEYAIEAFKANGIEYIVKPFDEETISEALQQYQKLKKAFSKDNNSISYQALKDILEEKKERQSSSLLVNYQDQILPIRINDIALFFIENEMTRLLTFERDLYFVDKSLDELDQLTDNSFFRASRQHLVNREAVKSASRTFSRKLSVKLSIPFKDSVTVSKAKAPDFLKWLSQ